MTSSRTLCFILCSILTDSIPSEGNVSTQSAEQITNTVSSKSAANDSHLFDLENYHSRVARYLDDKKQENITKEDYRVIPQKTTISYIEILAI